jgi:hypothetical protein
VFWINQNLKGGANEIIERFRNGEGAKERPTPHGPV